MTHWPALDDACGSAEHVPALLDRFEADPGGVWSELMDHLCPHLDTAYPASYAALPRLAETATTCAPDHLRRVLLAAGAIAACAPGHAQPGGPLEVFAAPLAVLHRLTDEALRTTQEEQDYVDLLQCLLSFEGAEVWDRCLEGLHTGEYEVDCPYCGVNVSVVFGEHGCYCASGDDMEPQDAATSPPRPARPDALDGLARRLHARALADGHEPVARAVTYLFGHAACPDCGTVFPVADRVTARWIP
ncbi:hypothetical protein [Kitasatospora sp. NPDC093102]|uniref:hypothetical protein n=1 Tax=Kitasatospora sp. NPDC093102 TaxID=3155069 RepID=UPI003435D825